MAPSTSSHGDLVQPLELLGGVGVAFPAAAADTDAVDLLLQHEADDAAEGLLIHVAVGGERRDDGRDDADEVVP